VIHLHFVAWNIFSEFSEILKVKHVRYRPLQHRKCNNSMEKYAFEKKSNGLVYYDVSVENLI